MIQRPLTTSTLFSLKGRTALVTGGSRGIGLMIAKGFVAQGAKVYISSRKAEVWETVAAELGDECMHFQWIYRPSKAVLNWRRLWRNGRLLSISS